jgi:hypothetical protein
MKKSGPDLDSIPKIIPGIAFRIIEGEAVLVNPENKMIYVLNHTGAFAWQKIDGKSNIKKIAQMIGEEYRIDGTEAEKDLRELFEGLSNRGLISWNKPDK